MRILFLLLSFLLSCLSCKTHRKQETGSALPVSQQAISSQDLEETLDPNKMIQSVQIVPNSSHPVINFDTKDHPFKDNPFYEMNICNEEKTCKTFEGDQPYVFLLSLAPGTYNLKIRQCTDATKANCADWREESYTQGQNPLVSTPETDMMSDSSKVASVGDHTGLIIGTTVTFAVLSTMAVGLVFLNDGAAKAGLPLKEAPANKAKFRIIHTNDMHSAMNAYESLSAYIEDQKIKARQEGFIPIVMDGGDFSSGSLAHVLGPIDGNEMNPELDFLKDHGSITTLGNHEWDATQEGLAVMMKKLGNNFPGGIVATNIKLKDDAEGKTNALKEYFFDGVMEIDENGNVKAWELDKKNGKWTKVLNMRRPIARTVIRTYSHNGQTIKMGFVGVMGPNAVGGSEATRKGSGVEFHDYTGSYVKEQVAFLRQRGAEVVTGIVHGGRFDGNADSPAEDKIFSKKVPGVDIVAAGHTHSGYAAETGGKTAIFQSKGHGQAVITDMEYDKADGAKRTLTVQRSSLADHVAIHKAWSEGDEDYKKRALPISSKTVEWKREFDKILNENPSLYTFKNDTGEEIKLTEATELLNLNESAQSTKEDLAPHLKEGGDEFSNKKQLGEFVTTAVRDELNIVLAEKGKQPVELFLTALELIRTDFPTDRPTTFADVFGMLSRGVMKNTDGKLVPDGGRIAVMDMKKGDLYRLIGLLEFYAHNVEVEATMGYSEGTSFERKDFNVKKLEFGIPVVANLKNFELNGKSFSELPDTIRIAMPAFIAENFRDKAGGIVNSLLAKQIDQHVTVETMDVLLARYLVKNRKKIEAKGVNDLDKRKVNAFPAREKVKIKGSWIDRLVRFFGRGK